jgi:hypothetical protein
MTRIKCSAIRENDIIPDLIKRLRIGALAEERQKRSAIKLLTAAGAEVAELTGKLKTAREVAWATLDVLSEGATRTADGEFTFTATVRDSWLRKRREELAAIDADAPESKPPDAARIETKAFAVHDFCDHDNDPAEVAACEVDTVIASLRMTLDGATSGDPRLPSITEDVLALERAWLALSGVESVSAQKRERRIPVVGATELIYGTIIQCAGCSELRYREIVCLPCDLPTSIREPAWECSCFDWPDVEPHQTDPDADAGKSDDPLVRARGDV